MSMTGRFRSISAVLSARIQRQPALIVRVTDDDGSLAEEDLARLPPEMRATLAADAAALATLPAVEAADLGPALDIEKTWHAIHFLVVGDAWEVRAQEPATLCILGGEELGDDGGYGPARLHGPAAVAAIAA